MTRPVAELSEEDRIQGIAELLATAARRYLGQQRPTPPRDEKPSSSRPQVWDLVDDNIEKQVLRYLQQQVSAEPVQIRTALGLPEMTLARRLARLRAAGLIRVTGKTRNARYELALKAGRN